VFLPFSQRGKSWEPKALELRSLAGIGSNDLLDPWSLAPKVGLLVVDADDALLQSLDDELRMHLLGTGGTTWSGGVLPIALPDGKRICILNPTHTRGRHKSTLMEEIAHAHLTHQPTKLIFNGDSVRARDFNAAQEEEAFGIGAAALLPWHSFFHRIDQGNTRVEIAEEYEVSEDLVRYRIQITGAYRLYQARQRAA
jgi:hypothetical protein